MRTVCILVSTYNGEKYLQEQLNSLYAQKSVNVKIFVRDDGSRDHTVAILEQNAAEHETLSFEVGANLGVTKSFFTLLTDAPDADYYAFCDQDDVWDSDKMACAVEAIEKETPDQPILYHSNLRVVDENLQFYRNAHKKSKVVKSAPCALANFAATGCTMVLNHSARKLLVEHLPADCTIFDSWIFLVCMFFGKVIYDEIPHIQYRQHSANVIGTNLKARSLRQYWLKFIHIFNTQSTLYTKNAENLYAQYADSIPHDDFIELMKFLSYKKSWKHRLALFFDWKIHGRTWMDDLLYRARILFGSL